jgi:hypothetical protein
VFQEDTADGRKTDTIARVVGNKLIKDQVPAPSTGYHTTREVREFEDSNGDGNVDTMKLILTIPKTQTESVRIYKRVK